ncbi:MAG TPA: thiamine pyrophosphate-binding protein [Actinomycetota bacterium]|nr:thiamine pyrophosphate-binding protein [Actinomycetota bacterium]
MAVRVVEAVGRALAELGVRDAFGLLGSGNFPVTEAMVRHGVRFVSARHECAAVSMADAYARVSGRVGVATLHQGPGLTNATTALAEAGKARIPLLVVAADTSAGAVRSNFRIDQAALAAAVGAVAERAHSPASALEDLARAWRRATVERRAVLFSLPLDVQGAEAPGTRVRPPPPPAPPAPDPEAVQRAADLVVASEAPVVLAGRGAVLSGAGAALEGLAERCGALLATSANAHGLFAGNPWSLGISGGFASPAAARLLRESDLVLAFGASLNMWTTRHGVLLGPEARVVQVDLDPDAIGAHRPVDLGLVADARLAAKALGAELDRRGHRARGRRREEVGRAIAEGSWANLAHEDRSTGDRVDPRTFSRALDRLLPAERTVAVDSGHFMGWPPMYLSVPDAAGFVFTQAFQSIGLGLSSAIGAAVARPDRLTVACLGDGGALMAAGEFETLVRLGLPLLVVVYNDAAYGAEVHHFGPQGYPVDLVRYPDPDLAGLARGLGAEAATVRSLGDLGPLEKWLERRDGPFVLDVKVVPEVVAEWLEEAFRAH